MTTINYETDIVAWANEQAWLVRNKQFDLLDIEHIAEENDAEWQEIIWGDAVYQASKETGLDHFPDNCPWSIEDMLSDSWLPPR